MADVGMQDITKSFGAVDVIHGVSLDIKHGEFVVLVGPSGCGKSTLLRMIAGLEDPTGGTITIGDSVVNELLPKERDVAMVFQSYALYPHMTVRENISFSLELQKRPKTEIDQAVKQASDILGLGEYLDRKPKALSGGQRQRVAMGRAIVRNPKVFLFDEPLSNLDAKLRTIMRKEVKLLHQRLKTTSIYVTHDQTEAMTMADKIVVMNAGVIEQIGSPMQLYCHPANLFVAGFIGAPQMNLFPGNVRPTPDGAKLELRLGMEMMIPKLSIEKDTEIFLGVRPEHLKIVDESALTAVVDLVEPLGNETHLSCSIDGEEIRLVTEASIDTQLNDQIGLDVDFSNAHFFNADTGVRIN
ncbi:MAG: sn-glycerol-3-phosphate ABC transporter ATP-binding protein UgpC [Gammaproteobacteria bacterium]|nr:sn-glycerol-3-phosphate ABC transporter ATP-binding protein UgpC [Gammaproteobacteria bacterium]